MCRFCCVDIDDLGTKADTLALDAFGHFDLDDADFVVEANSSVLWPFACVYLMSLVIRVRWRDLKGRWLVTF
jgi:hypothetical protein